MEDLRLVLGTIRIVDEEGDVRKSVRLTLTKAGYDVVDAEDGEKRIQQVRSGDNPVTVDAILCDIHMAKVHNGEEAVAYFRQQSPSVPVIVMTGERDLKEATDLMKQGVVDYLIKPVRPEKLTEVVSKHTKGHFYKDRRIRT